MTDSVDDAAAAFGSSPTLKARGDYLKKYGAPAYAEECAKWKSDPRTLAPGIRPENYGEEDKSTNPWATGDQENILSCIRSLPTRVCAELAKAANKKIDGTPLNK